MAGISLSEKVTIFLRYGVPPFVDVVFTLAIFCAMISVLKRSAVMPDALILKLEIIPYH